MNTACRWTGKKNNKFSSLGPAKFALHRAKIRPLIEGAEDDLYRVDVHPKIGKGACTAFSTSPFLPWSLLLAGHDEDQFLGFA